MIAVDIGGTYTRYKISADLYKTETHKIKLPAFLENLILNYRPEKIAVSFAGQVKDKKIISSPNTPFKNIDLSVLEKKYGVKIILENDMNCAALAQSVYFKTDNIAALYSGTGLGAGIVDNGKIIKGRGFAGEIGHIPYKPSPFKCGCGKDNCLELFASGSAIEKWSGYYNCEGLKCEKIKTEYIKALLYALGAVFSLFDPDAVVLGGGVIEHNRWVFDEIEKLKNEYIPKFNTGRILMTQLKDASLKGAEILLKDEE
jgi:glucokinase